MGRAGLPGTVGLIKPSSLELRWVRPRSAQERLGGPITNCVEKGHNKKSEAAHITGGGRSLNRRGRARSNDRDTTAPGPLGGNSYYAFFITESESS